jgi:hypothetical protein
MTAQAETATEPPIHVIIDGVQGGALPISNARDPVNGYRIPLYTQTFTLLKPQITIRKDHKGHKDRRILTSGAMVNFNGVPEVDAAANNCSLNEFTIQCFMAPLLPFTFHQTRSTR